jgi:hypothetical protein
VTINPIFSSPFKIENLQLGCGLFLVVNIIRDYVATLATAVKNGFEGLLAHGKSPKVSLLEAKFSRHRQDSKNFPKNILLS